MLGVGVPADILHLVQGDVGVLPAADEADRLPLEQDLALVPVVFAPHDGEMHIAVLQLLDAVAAVVGGDFEGDVRVLGRVGGQHLRQAVFGVVDGRLNAQGAADGVFAQL